MRPRFLNPDEPYRALPCLKCGKPPRRVRVARWQLSRLSFSWPRLIRSERYVTLRLGFGVTWRRYPRHSLYWRCRECQ